MVDKIPKYSYELKIPFIDEVCEEAYANIERQLQVSQDESLWNWFNECHSQPVEPYRIPSVELRTSIPEFVIECVQAYFKSMKQEEGCYLGQVDYKELRVWLYNDHAAIADDETAVLFKELSV